jgi:hypothetical protein
VGSTVAANDRRSVFASREPRTKSLPKRQLTTSKTRSEANSISKRDRYPTLARPALGVSFGLSVAFFWRIVYDDVVFDAAESTGATRGCVAEGLATLESDRNDG